MSITDTTVPATVWVVDDDETALMLSEEALLTNGFLVRTFSDAAASLVAAQVKAPDIVVVDLMMPGLDGFEFCTRLRELPTGETVPILMATSLEDADSINRAYQAGATDFTTKPLNWTIEMHRLRYLLRASQLATQFRNKEREARQAKEDWEQTFNAIPDIVTVLNPDFTVVRANKAAAKHFGISHERLIGTNCCKLFHGSPEPCSTCPGKQILSNHRPASNEVQCDMLGRPFEITISPVVDEQGRLVRLVHVARDLSERKQLEAELRQAQKMEALGTLAAGVAHDFNNLLTIILGYAQLVQQSHRGQENQQLQAIISAAQRGANLIQQLLVFSRRGRTAGQKHPCNINLTVQDLQKMLVRLLPKTVSLQTLLASDLRQTYADPNQLDQVLMNLSVNAGHAMAGGGTLKIETQNVILGPEYCRLHPNVEPGDYIRLCGSDTGHGMDPATLSRIFEPFFTTKKETEGTGLGLSVAFGIIQDHGGHINCESTVGKGTTFRIYLPVCAQGDLRHLMTPGQNPIAQHGSEALMVVDDEALVRSLVEDHFTGLGYTVYTAEDGEIAVQKYRGAIERPRVVLLDLGMPRMSGWECLEKLRILDPQVRVIIASGYGDEELERRALAQGASGFMQKPFSLTDVAQRLRRILDAPSEIGCAPDKTASACASDFESEVALSPKA